MKRCAGITAAALALLLGSAPPASALVKTHGMMLDSVATMIAADLLPNDAVPPGRPVVLLAPIQGDTLGVLLQRLLERLRQGGRDVRLWERAAAVAPNGAAPFTPFGSQPPDSTRPAGHSSGLELHARVDGASVGFVRRIRSFPFGVKGYERLTAMRASLTLQDPETREVLWARSSTRSVSDIVSKGDLAYVASGSAGINPPLPQGSGFRLLEPLIVLGVVAGLVVLFYSNRN